ncbi:MAG: orotidine-5'-phosphate decarboxylase [Ignavibacteria bacterium]|nr:orotidine-5'-phosphate decarboxylase [Ignavibacteria bacterium]
MTTYHKILQLQKEKKTRLTIGLDVHLEKLPKGFRKNILGFFEYNKKIIELTNQMVCAYKFNLAFFEVFGSKGLRVLERLLESLPEDVATIADAKRSDISSSSRFYAKAIFEHYKFDSATLNPLLGRDSLEPFFEYVSKLNFVLVLTSNSGAKDFQKIKVKRKPYYQIILENLLQWFPTKNLGFVVGATNPKEFKHIRSLSSNNFILTPGIGTQGGELTKILKENGNCPLLVNVSRDIIFAEDTENFEEYIQEKTKTYYQKLQVSE